MTTAKPARRTVREYVDIESAAALLRRSTRTIYRWIDLYNIRTSDNGKATEVHLVDVERVAAKVKRGRPRGSTRGPKY